MRNRRRARHRVREGPGARSDAALSARRRARGGLLAARDGLVPSLSLTPTRTSQRLTGEADYWVSKAGAATSSPREGVRFALDSPLEERVSSEPVSEIGSDSEAIMGDSGS
jgi:hypothetical protein